MFVVVVCSIIFLFMLVLLLVQLSDRHEWNGGLCRECGGRMQAFDICSGGATGYKCEGCDRTIWIGSIDTRKENTVYVHKYFGKIGFEKEVLNSKTRGEKVNENYCKGNFSH